MQALRSFFDTNSTPRRARELVMATLIGALLLSPPYTLTALADPGSIPPPPSSGDTAVDADMSARDDQLKSVEEQLLKQLSLGAKPTAQETAGTTLPNIKHVDVNPVVAKPLEPAAPSEAQPVATQTPISEPPPAPPAREPGLREPRTVSVVPVSQETAPVRPAPRRPTSKNQISSAQSSPKHLEQRVTVAESQVTILSKELEETQQKLAETEGRLRRAEGALSPSGVSASDSAFVTSSYEVFPVPADQDTSRDDTTSSVNSLPVARITKDRTPMRIGPGINQSSLLTLSRNSIVEIEHRTGTWYRIISPSGARGWVSGSVLLFDVDNFPGSTDRVMAYQPGREPTGIKY